MSELIQRPCVVCRSPHKSVRGRVGSVCRQRVCIATGLSVLSGQHDHTCMLLNSSTQSQLSIAIAHPQPHQTICLCVAIAHTWAGDIGSKNIRRPGLEPGTLRFLPIYSRMLLPTELSSGNQAVQAVLAVVCGTTCAVTMRVCVLAAGHTRSRMRNTSMAHCPVFATLPMCVFNRATKLHVGPDSLAPINPTRAFVPADRHCSWCVR